MLDDVVGLGSKADQDRTPFLPPGDVPRSARMSLVRDRVSTSGPSAFAIFCGAASSV